MDELLIQWIVIIGFLLSFLFVAPKALNATDFLKGNSNKLTEPSVFILTSGLVIAWIFAKSINNAATLGYKFGLVGGIGYGCYYFSFIVAGRTIAKLRDKTGFSSLVEFVTFKFGRGAARFFTIIISLRLFNDVWSNTLVIGTFFGKTGSYPYYGAIVLFTVLTLAYVLKGGLKTSLFTDTIQMVLFSVLLLIVIIVVLPSILSHPDKTIITGKFAFDSGLDFILLALLQSFSYPFHDPVLTDRAFITSTKVTRKSYFYATIIGFAVIVLFSLIGVLMKMNPDENSTLQSVMKPFGLFVVIAMNLILLTSATSTLDSTFSSFSKLWITDVFNMKTPTIQHARIAMICSAVLGTIPVFFNPSILSATTLSGTMVLGLAPIFIFWNKNVPKISFYLALLSGVFFGILSIFVKLPNQFKLINTEYGDLLSINFYAMVVILLVYFLPYYLTKKKDEINWESRG